MNGEHRMIEGNLLIRASAGTGKTFALATRFIRLMLFDRVDPGRIIALTFSRAAAQEIYTKLLERLWKAAADAEGADREHRNLVAGLPADQRAAVEAQGLAWSPEMFADLLRKVVAVQHLGAIATLDSFILRLVGNFPLEMGFQNALEVLDPVGERDEVDRAAQAILARSQDPDAFAAAFRAAKKGTFSRLCARTLGEMMEREGWRKFILENPVCKEWSADSMCAALGVPARSECPDLSDIPFNDVKRKGAVSYEESFVEWVQAFDGQTSPLNTKDGVVALMLHFWRNPDATQYDYTFYGKLFTVACGPKGAAAIRAGIRHMMNVYLRRQLEIVEAKIRLFAIIEREYDAATRRAGKLTFRDFTDAARDGSRIELDNLRFRFDARLDHWALDEFQDTSEVQWACLRDLVESAASGGGGASRSVIAVGDLKQSIYTWRGGDDRPFEEMMSWPWFGTDADGTVYGRIENSKTSYRYGKCIADFINRVFGAGNLRAGGLIPAARAAAVGRWLAGDCWLEHVPQYAPDGTPVVQDYVKVISARPEEDSDGSDAVLSALHAELASVWKAREDAQSAETVGILVRRNEDGMKIADYLRQRGMPVIWEGVNAVSDVPAVQGVLQLLKLAEHPEDTFAWTAVNGLLPIREMLMPDVHTAADASARMAEALSHQGLARTLKDVCGTLVREENGLDGLSCVRLRALVRLGVDYERRKATDYGVDGFARFVAAAGKRESASSANAVRILSIHRSKGLTLDCVFVPLFESDKSAIAEPTSLSALFGKGRAWVLPHLSADVAALNEQTKAVFEEQCDARLLDHLRLYYVALTRARHALYVLFPSEEHHTLLFRDLITNAVEGFPHNPDANGTVLFEEGVCPAFEPAKEKGNEAAPWTHTAGEVRLQRRSPSRLSHGGTDVSSRTTPTADVLFSDGYGAAAKHGIDVHDEYAKIEWADADLAARLPPSFRAAFVRPDASATVWRERSYELLVGQCWETGQFDRVVFTGAEGNRSATIYDFKTNACEPGENDGAFAERMRALYAPQMAAYRQALHRLTGIPLDRIRTALLLVSREFGILCEERINA